MKSTALALTVGCLLLAATGVSAQSPALATWNALQAKRAALPNFHQEFDADQTITFAGGDKRASKHVEIIDAKGPLWRQAVGRGSDARTAVYDGADLFEIDGAEAVKVQRKGKDAPTPGIYSVASFDLSKLVEVTQRPCGFNVKDRPCVVFEVPVRESMTQTMAGVVRVGRGASRWVFP